jgi:anti-anti-sigma factor
MKSETRMEDRGTYWLIHVQGYLDGRTRASRDLLGFLDRPAAEVEKHVVLDLAEVQYINSSMLGSFIRFLTTCQEAGARLLLHAPPANIANVLAMTGISEVLKIVESEAEAEEVLAGAPALRVRAENVNYTELENEIETILQGGALEDPDRSQLRRLKARDGDDNSEAAS